MVGSSFTVSEIFSLYFSSYLFHITKGSFQNELEKIYQSSNLWMVYSSSYRLCHTISEKDRLCSLDYGNKKGNGYRSFHMIFGDLDHEDLDCKVLGNDTVRSGE